MTVVRRSGSRRVRTVGSSGWTWAARRTAGARGAGADVRRRAVGGLRPIRRRARRDLPGRPQRPRRRDPGRVGDARRPVAAVAERGAGDRRAPGRGHGPRRAADRGAVPAARTTRWSSTSSRRGSTTAATSRIEASATSQFEQHIRAICGLPLGAADSLSPAAMVNLLGTGSRRAARLEGVAEALWSTGRPPARVRQARGVRASEDGPRDGPRAHRPTRRSTRARAAARPPALDALGSRR